MSFFFARLFAVILASAVFVGAVVIVFQIRPESAGGWGLMAGLGVGALLAPVIVYRAMLAPLRKSGPPNEGEGAGLSMGAGINRKRSENDDFDGFVD